jgi:PAS domain S-box-containing protein
MWRERATTMLLGVMGALGLPLVLVFVKPLLEARSYGTLAFSLFLVVADLFLAMRRTLSPRFRATWAVSNLFAAATPELFLGGDRGATAALVVAALMLGVLLVGTRIVVVLGGLFTLLIAITAWGHARGHLPLGVLVPIDWNTPQGWLGLWAVVAFVAALVVVAAEMMFRELRRALAEQRSAAAAREQALGDLIRQREATLAERERADAADAARAAVERTLADALGAVGAGVYEADLVRDVATWSDGMYRLFGYEPGSVRPSMQAWSARIHPDDLATILARPPKASPVYDYRVNLPDGRTRVLRAQMSTVLDESGRASVVRGVVTDVTAERETAEQLARLAEVASRTSNTVVVTDLDARIRWVNDAFVRLTGWSLEESIGRTPAELLQGPHTDPAARAVMRDAIAARAPFDVEVLNYARDGRQYWVQIESRVARDAEGRPTGFVAVETDVTERRVSDSRDALARRIAAVLLAAENVRAAADVVTRELVSELDCAVAQLWLVEPGNPHLVWSAGAAAPSTGAAGAEFLAITRSLAFAAGTQRLVGVGIPGVVWGTGRPVILDDFRRAGADGHTSRRLDAALAAGVHTFSAVPVLGPDGVLGVIELGGTAYYPGHERLPDVLARVAEQLASFILHDGSRRAFETVFANSPDPQLLIDEDGIARADNARAAALFGDVIGRPVSAFIDNVEDIVATALGGGAVPLQRRDARGAAGPFSAELTASAAPSSTKRVVILAVRDLTERHRMESALQRSLREKDTLLREVHHRVKNNLQIVSSLLTLQSDGMERGPARDALDETVLRVRSMAYVHQQLYGTENVDGVDFGAYARTLATALQGSLDPRARLAFAVEPVEVAIDVAVPCGLILNELLTNALKHGRSADGTCTLHVDVAPADADLVLVVRDAGPGMPDTARSSTSLGMQLVRSLTRQLRGRIDFLNDGGSRVTLRVPLPAKPGGATDVPPAAPGVARG